MVNVAKLLFVPGTILESDDRTDPDGKSKIKCLEQKLSIESNSDGSNTMFTY